MLSYDVVDVFAETPFAGNQLAVVHGAADLSDEALLAIAREFNFSETTFPTPLDRTRYRVRIFTPGGEVPFAGHPTLGTAWVLREHGMLDRTAVVQECRAGEVGVVFGEDDVELAAVPRDLVGPVADDAVDALLAEIGLAPADRVGEVWLAGTGLTFVHIPVREAAVAQAVLGRRAIRASADLPPTVDPLDGVNVYAVEDGPDALVVHSRVFLPGLTGAEDPATGSAAAGLGLALHANGLLEDGGRYRIRQGVEIGRPSVLTGTVAAAADRITSVRVSGRVQQIARGQIRIP